MSALYLYGFAGAEARACVRQLAGRAGLSMDERHPVETVGAGRVLALTCEVDADEYRSEDRQPDGWLAERACRHAALLSELLAGTSVLPVKFGALFSSLQQLMATLAAHEPALAAALDRLRGHAEWGVKAYVDEPAALSALGERDPNLRARRAALPSHPGARYLHARQLEVQLASALRAQVAERSRLLTALMAAIPAELMDLPLGPVPAGEGVQMVFHAGVLLPLARRPSLFDALEAPARQWVADGWRGELTGPWPAYHFGPAMIGDALVGCDGR